MVLHDMIVCKLCNESIDSTIDSHFDNWHYEDFLQWLSKQNIKYKNPRYEWLNNSGLYLKFIWSHVEVVGDSDV